MDDLALYLVFLVPPLLFGLAVQWWLKQTFARNAAVPTGTGLTGAEVARTILDRNGLHDVPIGRAAGGPLSDHYDPRKREVFLLTVVLLCLGAALVSSLVGLSLALGAFIAGLMISESEYSHHALGEVLPMREVVNSRFFVSIGMLFDFRTALAQRTPRRRR